jgi:hypothetical protein
MPSQTIANLPTVSQVPALYPDPLPGIIPFGSLVLLVGPPKCGKTALLASWLQRWRDGQTICGRPTNPPNAIGIITTDHKWAQNQGQWFAKAGYPEIRHVALRDDRQIKWREVFRSIHGSDHLLKSSLDTLALPPGGLVVLDVSGPFISNRLNDYNAVLGGMGSLGQILDDRQLTCIGTGHMGKQRADPKDRYLRPHERILGSGAQIGFSDTTMYLLGPADTGKPYHTFGWLPTHEPEGEFWLTQGKDGLFVPYTGNAHEETLTLDQTLAAVFACVTAEPQPLKDIVAVATVAALLKRSTICSALTELCRLGMVLQPRHGYYQRVNPS